MPLIYHIPRIGKGRARRTRSLALLLTGALVLSAACTGAGSPAGSAPQSVSNTATSATTTANETARPSGGNRAAVATPHPATPDPCGLVTAAETETVLGARPFPAAPRRSTDSAEVRCTYEVISGGQGRAVAVAVWKGSEARPVYDLRRTTYGQGGGVVDVPGLGDRAFTVKGTDNWINVLKGDVYLSVEIDSPGLSAAELQTRVMTLVRMALGRL